MFTSDDSSTVLSGGFDSDDENFVLHFTKDVSKTRLFSPLGADAETYANKPLTYNHHMYGVTPNRFLTDRGLSEIFTPTSISYDLKGKSFVATMESDKYPFFGTQFHPEKQAFAFYPETKIDHSEESIFYNRYFADFFINQCKLNSNKFDSWETETKEVVQNYLVVSTDGYYGPVYAF